MSRTTSTKTVTVASSGNQALYAGGLQIYGDPSSYGAEDSVVLVQPDQFVIWDVKNKVSVAYDSISRTANPVIQLGLAIDLNNDGIADYIRWDSEGLSGCGAVSLEARAADCGLSPIVDVLFGCGIECGTTYTIEVQVWDQETLSLGEHPGIGYLYSFSYTYPCGGCATGDCEEVPNADEVMCGLYNTIKGINPDPNWKIKLNNFPLVGGHNYKFDVAMLYNTQAGDVVGNTTYEYCFAEGDGTCANCSNITPAVGGVNWTALGEAGPTIFSPINYVEDGSAEAHTTRGQLERVANLITVALDGSGTATFRPAIGNCCTGHKLEINTCVVGFELLDHEGVAITPCDTSNAFSAQTIYSQCQNCDSANTAITPTVGLRFFLKPLLQECQCIPGNKVNQEYVGEFEVFPKFGFKPNGGVFVLRKQEATIAEGQGFQWQAREIEGLRQDLGEQFVEENFGGKYGFPEENDLLSHVTTDCKRAYCVINLVGGDRSRHNIAGLSHTAWSTTNFLIPSGDTTTITQLTTALNSYHAGQPCGLAAITCDSEDSE